MFGTVCLITDFDLSCGRNAGPAFDPVNFVFLEQKLNAFGVAVDHLSFVVLHFGPIHHWIVCHQAHFCKIMLSFMQLMAGMQERFGWDAAHIQTGATQGVTPLHTGCFQPQLRTSNGADIAAGAGADHNYIIRSHMGGPLSWAIWA